MASLSSLLMLFIALAAVAPAGATPDLEKE
jgi:hypothetical protein